MFVFIKIKRNLYWDFLIDCNLSLFEYHHSPPLPGSPGCSKLTGGVLMRTCTGDQRGRAVIKRQIMLWHFLWNKSWLCIFQGVGWWLCLSSAGYGFKFEFFFSGLEQLFHICHHWENGIWWWTVWSTYMWIFMILHLRKTISLWHYVAITTELCLNVIRISDQFIF